MDEQEEQRGKLASVGSDNTRQRQDIRQRVLEATRERPDRGRRSPGQIVVEWWERFWATSVWEKGIVVGGTALAGIAAIVAFLALSGGGSDQPTLAQGPAPRAALGAPAPTATVPPTVASTATPMPTEALVVADPTPDDVEPPPAVEPPPPNRQNCQAIAGTAYLSSVEREWFLAHCLDADAPAGPAVPPSQPVSPSSPSGPPPPPPPTPVPTPTSSTGVSASEAIALAAGWMVSQTSNTYSISQESCYATHMGARWVVVCQAELVGCQGDVCSTTLSACVFEQPLLVAPADSC